MKFKKTSKQKDSLEKKSKSLKFPRNYRIIPESWSKDEVAFFGGSLFILAAILIVTLSLFLNLKESSKLSAEKFSLIKEQIFWQNQVKTRPDFRDAYFSLALVDYRLSYIGGARSNLEKSLELDPNFKEGRKFEKLLNGNN